MVEALRAEFGDVQDEKEILDVVKISGVEPVENLISNANNFVSELAEVSKEVLELRDTRGIHGSVDGFESKMQNVKLLIIQVSNEIYGNNEVLEHVFYLQGTKINGSVSLEFVVKIEVPIAWCVHFVKRRVKLVNYSFSTTCEFVHYVWPNALCAYSSTKVLVIRPVSTVKLAISDQNARQYSSSIGPDLFEENTACHYDRVYEFFFSIYSCLLGSMEVETVAIHYEDLIGMVVSYLIGFHPGILYQEQHGRDSLTLTNSNIGFSAPT